MHSRPLSHPHPPRPAPLQPPLDGVTGTRLVSSSLLLREWHLEDQRPFPSGPRRSLSPDEMQRCRCEHRDEEAAFAWQLCRPRHAGRVAAPDRGPCQAGQSSSHWGLGPNPQQMTRCYFAFLCHYFFFRKHGRNGCYGLKRLWVFPVPWLPFPVTVPQAEHNLNTACHLNLRFIILVHSKFSKKKKKKRILMLFTVP